MSVFEGQVNPTGTIHTPPPSVPAVNRLTGGQIGAFGTIVVDLILAQVAMALGGVDIFGIKPFAFLTDWAAALQQQAVDAYKNSFAVVDVVSGNAVGTTTSGTLNSVYSAAAAVNTTANTGVTNAATANGNVQTTWNNLWDGSKGTTGAANKTASDVKAAVGEVRNTGIAADGKAQDTIDGVYSAVMGGSYTGMPANYVKPALTGLTYTARNSVATGSNLVVDTGGENASYWTQTGSARSSSYAHTGSYSVGLTSAGSTARTLYFNTIDTGAVQAYFVRQSEIYYVECYLYSASAMGTVSLVAQVNGSTVNTITSVSMSAGTWIKLSGQYTIPTGVNTASFGIQLGSGATTSGTVVYVDDMLVREITNAQTAQVDVESTWNQIYNGVYNLSSSGKNLTDVFNALFLTKSTADGGVSAAGTAATNAGIADGKAVTADGKAVIADGKAVTAQTTADTADILATMAASANNLVLSPDFEESSVRRIDANAGVAYTISYSTAQYRNGVQSLKLVAGNSNSGSNWGGVYLCAAKTNGTMPSIAIVPGQVYHYDIVYYANSANTGTGMAVGVVFNITDIDGVIMAKGNASPSIPAKGSWQRLQGSYTIPATLQATAPTYGEPVSMIPIFGIYGAVATGDTFYIDRAILYR